MIDVIIPVYNTPKDDLIRCLNSVFNQDFNDYMVYIIDDGSSDDIKSFLDDYCINRKNVVLKHIENGGVSNARNYGLSISKSKYFCFVDSDDEIINNYLSESFKFIEDKNLDIIIGGYNELVNGSIVKVRKSNVDYLEFDSSNMNLFFDKLLSSKNREETKEIGNCPVGRIYTRLFRRTSVDGLVFNKNISLSEDTLYMINSCDKVSRIGICSNIWYNYYINEYSLSHKDVKIEKHLSFIDEIYNLVLNEENLEKRNSLKMRIFKSLNYLCECFDDKSIIDKKYFDIIKDVNLNNYLNISDNELKFLDYVKSI